MTVLHTVLAIGVLFLLLFPGCKIREPNVRENAAVVVNGIPISEDEVGMRMQQMAGHRQPETRALRDRVIEDLVADELLYQKGKKLGLDKDEKFRHAVSLMELRIKEFKRSEIARRVRSTQISARVEVSEEDVRNYYDRLKEGITRDYRLFVIRFGDETAAAEALEKLAQGVAFEAVAREAYAPAAQANTTPWDTGFLHWNQIPAEWVEALPALNTGEMSHVLGSRKAGWFIVKLIDRKYNPDADYERMSASIMNRLRDQKLLDAYHRYIEELKKDAHIVQK